MNEASQKKTLIMAQERLCSNASQIETIVVMMERLVAKFERTENDIVDTANIAMSKESVKPQRADLIDLFLKISDRLERANERIGSNLDKALNMID